MLNLDKQSPSSPLAPARDAEAISHLKQAVGNGEHWYIALLEAIRLWSTAEEIHNGRTYCYLIAGEAFDWLLLAERLCEALDGLLPDDEKNALLFHGETPLNLTIEKFRGLIGSSKYHQYLNYFYGITVEEALILAVQAEIRKERSLFVYAKEYDAIDEAYRRIYDATRTVLLKQFRREKEHCQSRSIDLTELKEFTYWLFKYRLKKCDKARVASDTKKALVQLRRQWTSRGVPASIDHQQ